MSTSNNDYQILGIIGSGGFGTLYKVRSVTTGDIYALKKVAFSGLNLVQQKSALREMLSLSSVNHPNIVKLFASFMKDSALNLIMEFFPNGDLLKVIFRYKIVNKRKEN